MEETGISRGRAYLWSMAAITGIAGTAFLGSFLLSPREDLFESAFMIAFMSLLFFMFGFALFAIYKSGEETVDDVHVGSFECRHCRRRFSEEKVWKMHEKSCVEMKL